MGISTKSRLKVYISPETSGWSTGENREIYLYDDLVDVCGNGFKVVICDKIYYAHCATNGNSDYRSGVRIKTPDGTTKYVHTRAMSPNAPYVALSHKTLTDAKHEMKYVYPNSWNTMFYLPDIIDISDCTTLDHTFDGCKDLEKVSRMDTSRIKNMSNMFSACTSLPATFPWVIDISNTGSYNYNNIQDMFTASSVKKVSLLLSSEQKTNALFNAQSLALVIGVENVTII